MVRECLEDRGIPVNRKVQGRLVVRLDHRNLEGRCVPAKDVRCRVNEAKWKKPNLSNILVRYKNRCASEDSVAQGLF